MSALTPEQINIREETREYLKQNLKIKCDTHLHTKYIYLELENEVISKVFIGQ